MLSLILSLLIAAFAFGTGATKLFKKGTPLYWQLYVCAAGCFALRQLSETVNFLCGIQGNISVGMLGIFGCNFFLLSADYGTLDKVVDDGSAENKPARKLALLAPVVTAALIASVFFAWRKNDLVCGVLWLAMLLPMLPASYFNLKHLLMPPDDFELLRATRPCNLASLGVYLLSALCGAACGLGNTALAEVTSVALSASMLWLVCAAVKGRKKWKTCC